MTEPTMTLHDAAEAMRANCISCSEDVLGQMIEEGKLPFAVGCRKQKGIYYIFRYRFYQWLRAMIGPDVIEI